jgi:hypothetical protein
MKTARYSVKRGSEDGLRRGGRQSSAGAGGCDFMDPNEEYAYEMIPLQL